MVLWKSRSRRGRTERTMFSKIRRLWTPPRTRFEAAIRQLGDFQTALSNGQEQTVTEFAETQAAFRQVRLRLNQGQLVVETQLGELASDLTDRLTPELEKTITGFTDVVDQRLNDELTEFIDMIRRGLVEVMEDFDGAAKDLAESFAARVEAIANRLRSQVSNKLDPDLTGTLDDLVARVLGQLGDEVDKLSDAARDGVSVAQQAASLASQVQDAQDEYEELTGRLLDSGLVQPVNDLVRETETGIGDELTRLLQDGSKRIRDAIQEIKEELESAAQETGSCRVSLASLVARLEELLDPLEDAIAGVRALEQQMDVIS